MESALWPEGLIILSISAPKLAVLANRQASASGRFTSAYHAALSLSDAVSLPSAEKGLAETTWHSIHVSRVRTRSLLLRHLSESRVAHALSDNGASAFCDVSHLDSLKAISKDTLRNFDRLRRRVEKDFGPVLLDPVTDPALLHTTAFGRFVALEDSGWKGTTGAGTSLAVDTRAQAFFREVMRRFGEDNRARIDVLTLAGRDAAAQLTVRAGPTWFLLKIGFHPDFKDVGPGGILLKAFLEEMVANPDILEVNLTTSPPWAARWHFQTEPVYNLTIEGPPVRSPVLGRHTDRG